MHISSSGHRPSSRVIPQKVASFDDLKAAVDDEMRQALKSGESQRHAAAYFDLAVLNDMEQGSDLQTVREAALRVRGDRTAGLKTAGLATAAGMSFLVAAGGAVAMLMGAAANGAPGAVALSMGGMAAVVAGSTGTVESCRAFGNHLDQMEQADNRLSLLSRYGAFSEDELVAR